MTDREHMGDRGWWWQIESIQVIEKMLHSYFE
jgi:hypothetical protein